MGESERACDGEEGEISATIRKRRKESSFMVDSKMFEIVFDERKGKPQFLILEKKRGVSSWVRLGSESLGFFMEGLIHCIKDEKEGRWGKEWKDKGKSYSLTRGFNRAGWFLRLGVVDLERKRFCIFIPRGREDKRGWVTMAEKIHQMEGSIGRKANMQEVRAVGKSALESSYVTVVKRPSWRDSNSIKVKVRSEETLGNLQKLEHCIVASWKSRTEREEDLERLGSLWANS